METLGALFSGVMGILQMPFTLWGYAISFWNILVFDVVVGVIGWFVWEVLLGD